MRGLTLTPEVIAEARNALMQAPHGSRMQVVGKLAERIGRSPSQLLRILGPLSIRKTRSDRGTGTLTAKDLEAMAGYLAMSQRKTGKILGAVKEGREILWRSGLISEAAAQLSVATWNRELRRAGLSKEAISAPSLATELDSRHPNDWHLVDASVGILFYLTKSGKMSFQRYDVMDAKNKPQQFADMVQKRLMLIRWVLVDHYSGAVVVDYREAAGETALDLTSFLHHAWSDKGDARWPFKGVPHHLYADQGSAQKSSYISSLAESLGFQVHLHESSHTRADAPAARATGAVESVMRVWEHFFESRWRHSPPTGGLAQVRAEARDACIALNSSLDHKLTRSRCTRSELWMDIRDDQVRLPPESLEVFLQLAVSAPFSRDLDNYGRISVDGQKFKIPSCPWYPGEKLQVKRIAADATRLEVINPRTGETLDALLQEKRRNGRSTSAAYLGEAQKVAPGQVGARQPLHNAARLRQDVAENISEKTGMAAPGAIDTSLGRMADKVTLEFAPRQGTLIMPAVSGRRIDIWDAVKLASERLGRQLEAHEMTLLEKALPDRRFDELEALKAIEALAEAQGGARKVLTFGGAR